MKTILPIHVQLPNVTVLKSTLEGNLRTTTLPKNAKKAHILPPITSGAIILSEQQFDHRCIATFTNTGVIIYNK